MALQVGQGEKDSIKLHIKVATCDLCYLMILYNKCNFSYHQCLEINCVYLCGSESRRHADRSEAPVWKWCARQKEWQRQWRIWDWDVSMLTFIFLKNDFNSSSHTPLHWQSVFFLMKHMAVSIFSYSLSESLWLCFLLIDFICEVYLKRF